MLTSPDTFPTGNTISIPYHRVQEIYLPDGFFGQSVRVIDEKGVKSSSELMIHLPRLMADGLIVAAQAIKSGSEVNCHRFSRFLTGGGSVDEVEKFEPVLRDITSRPRVDGLPVGAIGLVGVDGWGAVHSIVGLGEESFDGLQVMSYRGEIGVASNSDVVAGYRGLYNRIDKKREVDLYAAPHFS